MSEGFWIGLQVDYEAAHAKDALSKTLSRITPWRAGTEQRAPAAAPRTARSLRR
jgi:hypothetical protein